MQQVTKNIGATTSSAFSVKGGTVLGQRFWDEYNVAANTSATTWQLYRAYTTPVLEANSIYRLAAAVSWALNSAASNFQWRFTVDGVEKWLLTREPQDAATTQDNLDYLFTYHTVTTLHALALRIEYRTTAAAPVGYIRFSKMEGERVR